MTEAPSGPGRELISSDGGDFSRFAAGLGAARRCLECGVPHGRLLELVRIAFAITGAWLVVGLLNILQYETIKAFGRAAVRPEWAEMIAVAFGWALLTPFVVYVAERLPFGQRGIARGRPITVAGNTPLAWTVATLLLTAIAGCAVIILSSFLLGAMTLSRTEVLRVGAAVFTNNLFLATYVVGATFYGAFHRASLEWRVRAERIDCQLADARLRRLRCDLEPHFLFNTLNAVATLVHIDPRGAEIAIGKLVDLLGHSTDMRDRPVVPLREELEFAERYLALQKLRFGQKLQSSLRVAEDRLLGAGVPPLILQPLIENSVKYGLGRKAGTGRIEVRAFSPRDGFLRLEVRDDGPGCEPEVLQTKEGVGVGIANTRARLESLYQRAGVLRFRFEEAAFVGEITIPLRWV